MTTVDPTSTLGTQPLNPPAGIKLETPEQQSLYRASLEFERFFVQQLLKPMENASKLPGAEEDGASTGSTSGYTDMAQDQLTQAVLDGGGLGLAATLYGQMAEAAGISTKPAAATTTPPAAGSGTGTAPAPAPATPTHTAPAPAPTSASAAIGGEVA